MRLKKVAFRHYRACVNHAGFTQLRPVHQAHIHCRLADFYFDGHGDKQGVEAKKAALRHYQACVDHAGFSQLSTSSQQRARDRANELEQLLSHSSRELSRDEIGSTENLQLSAACADTQPLNSIALASRGLPLTSHKRKDVPKAEDYVAAKRLRYSYAVDIGDIPFYESDGITTKIYSKK